MLTVHTDIVPLHILPHYIHRVLILNKKTADAVNIDDFVNSSI